MKIKLRINETVFTCGLGIFVYAFYGIMNPSVVDFQSNMKPWVYFFAPVLAMLLYLVVQKGKRDSVLAFDLSLSAKRFWVQISLATIVSFLLAYFFNQSLVGDELFYSTYGFSHSLELLAIVGPKVALVDGIDSSIALRFISFCALLGFGFFVYVLMLSNKYSYLLLGIVVLSALVIARLALSYLGGNELVHAPLAGSYTLISGTIFGLSDLSIQSGQVLVYIIFGYFVFTRFSSALESNWVGISLTLAIFSIPAFFYLSSVLEPVIWSIICSTVVLCVLTNVKFNQHKSLMYLIVFLSFFRIGAVFSIIPLLSHLLINGHLRGDLKSKLESLISILSPVLIFIPFFVFSYIKGSAATSESTVTLSRIFEASIDGTMWSLYIDVLSPYWLVLYGLLIIISLRSKFTQINIIYFCFLTIFFFSLNERVWGFTKYRLEVFIPLFISLALSITNKISSRLVKNGIGVVGIFAAMLNLNTVYGFPSTCSQTSGEINDKLLDLKFDFGCNYLSRVPFNFSNAIDFVRSREAMAATYIPGVYYGAFIHVLNGANVSDFLLAKEILKDQEELNSESVWYGHDANPDAIHDDTRIEYVLLGYVANLEHIKSSLILRGWSVVYTDADSDGFGLETFILQRPSKSVSLLVDPEI